MHSQEVPVGNEMYALKVVEGPIVVAGETFASYAYHSLKEIHVDQIIPDSDRLRVACLACGLATAHRLRNYHPVPVLETMGE